MLHRRSRLVPIFLACLLSAFAGSACATGHTALTWYGHAAFKIVTPEGHVLLLDPWITNPANPHGKQDLAALTKVDLILITHGHFDHVGDAVAIAKRTGAQLVTNFDLGSALVSDLGYPANQATMATLGNAGGSISMLNDEVSITFEPAVHGSTVSVPSADGTQQKIEAGGNPGGFVIRIKHGPTFYDTGDTAVFGDMKLIPEFDHINVMLACIGDHFTMGPTGAALAVKFVHPDVVIPMHYGTFPVLTGTPAEFGKALKAQHLKTRLDVMQPGQTVNF